MLSFVSHATPLYYVCLLTLPLRRLRRHICLLCCRCCHAASFIDCRCCRHLRCLSSFRYIIACFTPFSLSYFLPMSLAFPLPLMVFAMPPYAADIMLHALAMFADGAAAVMSPLLARFSGLRFFASLLRSAAIHALRMPLIFLRSAVAAPPLLRRHDAMLMPRCH